MSEHISVDFTREFAGPENARIHRELLAMANAITHLDEAGCKVLGVEISSSGLRPLVEVSLPHRSEFEILAKCVGRATFNGVSHITMGFDFHGVRVRYHTTRDAEQVSA
ncbi:MAG: hypothetical protein CVV18_00375 [Gammaproteobacteria bacterium HGW-Gammaproteobacteria-8]|jgi:hypothetical protein|nr:MAG: hypothetical protein CVV18_00375 [Gammaproteobacteria bacterium HGW-Gammaproteobacteria-8]